MFLAVNNNFELSVDASSGKYQALVVDSDGGNHIQSKTVTNGWHHLSATIADSTFRFYINGTLRGETGIGTMTQDADASAIGEDPRTDVSDDHFNGYIDDVRLYSRALEPWEISQLYRQNHGRDLRARTVMK
jgi:hypothetical protein